MSPGHDTKGVIAWDLVRLISKQYIYLSIGNCTLALFFISKLLQQMEIDGSCQTKVPVSVNTELYIIVPVRQRSRYNQLSLYQIRKIEYTSVPVNTELRFQSSTMWHDYMLSKCQLGNQSKKEKNMRT